MKKAPFLLTVALVLTLLSACGGDPSADGFDWPENPKVEQKNDSLTIYSMNLGKEALLLPKAVTLFRAYHPNVEIEMIFEDYDEGQGFESYQQMATEIMAGKGPDILLIHDSYLDVEKLVRQGVFADMEPFFEADGFDWAPYNQAVMDGGVWGGHRYVIPLSYDFPLLVSTRAALEEADFDVEACGDFTGFLEETTRYMEDPANTCPLFFMSWRITKPAEFSGLPIVDYSTGRADLSSPNLKASLQWMKTLNERFPEPIIAYGGLEGAAAVRDGRAVWTSAVHAGLGFYWMYAALKTVGEAVMMPIRSVDGGIQAQIESPVAVRANSENLQNAYDFIKILLGKEVQGGFAGSPMGMYLSVLDEANAGFYQKPSSSPTHLGILKRGEQGFYSTTNEFDATDHPTEEEFEQFMGYTREITGTYYGSNISLYLYANMRPFLYGDVDYDETLEDVQTKLEIYLTE